jgi:phenylacetate-CoA ligase
VFPAAQVDLYGSTEAGYIFVGDAFQDNSRVIDANAFVELVPWRGEADVFQTQVTTRNRRAMPLLRYHTGDVVRRFPTGFRILGRERDLHIRRDGGVVSASEIDAALPDNFACWHYCLVQTAETRWDFHYVADHPAPKETGAAVARALGEGVRVNAFRRRYLQPASSGKFSLLKPLVK